MKLIIFGGTGLIGQEFVHHLEGFGYEIFVVSRNSKKVNSIFQGQVHPIQWRNDNGRYYKIEKGIF